MERMNATLPFEESEPRGLIYRLWRMLGSSDRFGVCDVCGQHSPDLFSQATFADMHTVERRAFEAEGRSWWPGWETGRAVVGCFGCLEAQRLGATEIAGQAERECPSRAARRRWFYRSDAQITES